jgi:hypothetical protein
MKITDKRVTLAWLVALALTGLLVGAASATALTTWVSTISGTNTEPPVAAYMVFSDKQLTTPYNSGASLSDIDLTKGAHTETYYIKNVGNINLIFTGVAAVTGKASASWSTPNPVTIVAGAVGNLTLTLASTGVGSWNVTVSLEPSLQ